MHALILLGEREIRKWIALVTAAMLGQNKVPELARLAIVRGKFCESYAPPEKADQYFLTGLFSLLEPMLERPMSQLVAELPISNESRIALLGGDNELANLLEICEMCERGEFEELRKKEKVPETISQRFQRATMWADIVLGTAL
jgi:EAL and modified HD-GYP domain-containing signal transduction protein